MAEQQYRKGLDPEPWSTEPAHPPWPPSINLQHGCSQFVPYTFHPVSAETRKKKGKIYDRYL